MHAIEADELAHVEKVVAFFFIIVNQHADFLVSPDILI